MTRSTIFGIVMMAMMAMVSVNSYGQGRGHMGGQGRGTEMRGGQRMRGGMQGMIGRGGMRGGMVARGSMVPRVGRDGFLPGWEGRVRFMDGRWGYFRDNSWYWYDTYFEPGFYYGRPISYFGGHLMGPVGRAIVGTAVGGAILGGIIGALVH